jgi:hypothetical protein
MTTQQTPAAPKAASSGPIIVQYGEVRDIPLNKLKASPKNVRRVGHSAQVIESRAASITYKGVLQPLVVEPEIKDGQETGYYLVSAGEGRRQALRLLAKRKALAKGAPVRCVVDTTNDPAEVSMDENLSREPNQIAKAYGENNSILDNCHVRVAFSTNDERTARRISDSLGTATEMRAMKNYAGHRLSPWLGHLMVSRQETARPLLTPGEVMQLPPDEALVQISGVPPIRATKVRYYIDRELIARVAPPPTELSPVAKNGLIARVAPPPTELSPVAKNAPSDWVTVVRAGGVSPATLRAAADEGGHRIEPEFEAPVEPTPPPLAQETWLDPEVDNDESAQAEQARRFRVAARQAALDPDDGIPL